MEKRVEICEDRESLNETALNLLSFDWHLKDAKFIGGHITAIFERDTKTVHYRQIKSLEHKYDSLVKESLDLDDAVEEAEKKYTYKKTIILGLIGLFLPVIMEPIVEDFLWLLKIGLIIGAVVNLVLRITKVNKLKKECEAVMNEAAGLLVIAEDLVENNKNKTKK